MKTAKAEINNKFTYGTEPKSGVSANYITFVKITFPSD